MLFSAVSIALSTLALFPSPASSAISLTSPNNLAVGAGITPSSTPVPLSALPAPPNNDTTSTRRSTTATPYYIQNVQLGTYLTPLNADGGNGDPVGLAAYNGQLNQVVRSPVHLPYLARLANMVDQWYITVLGQWVLGDGSESGNYWYIENAAYANTASPLYFSSNQLTSSNDYAPGYTMGQLSTAGDYVWSNPLSNNYFS